MKPLAKLGYLAAACALLITTFSIIGPRAVRAAVATLVQVANTPANPVPTVATDNPALQPFAITESPTGTATFNAPFPAPAGKTWAIETLSVICASPTAIPTGQTPYVGVTVVTGGTPVYYYFAPTQTYFNTVMIVNQPFRAYADPGTTVYIGAQPGIPLVFDCTETLSGHLVNPPI
jgi:hypothetical protein